MAFINSILEHLDIKYEVPDNDLANLPITAPFITVSNHPFGGIDALILLKILMAASLRCQGDGKFPASAG
ncbi:MAG: hypothetical protein MZV63_52455 [Marinilabiliales bacterium]|nr:hypothetical protein [Marinilabiliales bacterium]